jgi:hypothetical protein
MMIGSHPSAAAIEGLEYMRKHGLGLDDLIETGGEDLRSPDQTIAARARAVSRAWEMMTARGLRFVDFEEIASRNSNFGRYQKQLKNQRVIKQANRPVNPAISEQNQTLKKLTPSYCANETQKAAHDPVAERSPPAPASSCSHASIGPTGSQGAIRSMRNGREPT